MEETVQKDEAADPVTAKPLVSVIMPARNVSKYIDEAMLSVLKQRGVPFEFLVADDGSGDTTWERVQSYEDDPRLRAWKFEKKRGPAAARNFLISRARGKFLTFCDADDKLLPGFLKTFSAALKKNPKAGVVYGNSILLSSKGKPLRKQSRRPSGKWDLIEGMLNHSAVMIRRPLFRKAGGYRQDLPYLEDCEFFSRLAEVTAFLFLQSKPLYAYRQRRGSLSRKFQKKRRHYYLKIVRKMILRRYGFKVSW